jgi:hypothetical protein
MLPNAQPSPRESATDQQTLRSWSTSRARTSFASSIAARRSRVGAPAPANQLLACTAPAGGLPWSRPRRDLGARNDSPSTGGAVPLASSMPCLRSPYHRPCWHTGRTANVTKRNLSLKVKGPCAANTLIGGRLGRIANCSLEGRVGHRWRVGHASGSRESAYVAFPNLPAWRPPWSRRCRRREPQRLSFGVVKAVRADASGHRHRPSRRSLLSVGIQSH